MIEKFDLIKQYLFDLNYEIVSEDLEDFIVVIDDEDNGIKNLIIDCEDTIVILEQIIMKVPSTENNLFKRLLQMNRELVHGAFVIDENSEFIIFRDTLQLENLDRNELEGSIHALSLGLSEFGSELLEFSK